MIYLNMLGQGIIILHSSEAILDLMERRSSIYSDRPKAPMVGDLMGFDFIMTLVPYGTCRNRAAQVYDAEVVLTRTPMVKLDRPANLSVDNINGMAGVHSGN